MEPTNNRDIMDKEKIQLREREVVPTDDVLKQVLGDSFAAYKKFLDALPGLDIEPGYYKQQCKRKSKTYDP